MEETFSNLETYGYIGLFLYSLGGGFVALLGAGVLSFLGKMDLGHFLSALEQGLPVSLTFLEKIITMFIQLMSFLHVLI